MLLSTDKGVKTMATTDPKLEPYKKWFQEYVRLTREAKKAETRAEMDAAYQKSQDWLQKAPPEPDNLVALLQGGVLK